MFDYILWLEIMVVTVSYGVRVNPKTGALFICVSPLHFEDDEFCQKASEAQRIKHVGLL